MTFIEALKTGRPIRRSSWWYGQGDDRQWLMLSGGESEWTWIGGAEASGPTRFDMLSTDWEALP